MSLKTELGGTVEAMAVDRQAALAAFERELGSSGVIADAAGMARYLHDWAGDYKGRALAVLRPASVAEIQAVVRICRAQGLVLVPQGGNTGLVNGAFGDLSRNGVIVSTERMNAIRSVDETGFTIQVEAGCTLQQVKDAAEEQGFLFPLALGAQGSCQIGGNAATNAGGLNVLRYGMARDLILGLEVVLPDAEIWNGMTGLRKDNRGYDLDQLFIGAEGTLGIITGVELKLFSRHARTETAYLGLASFEDALTLLSMARRTCSDLISAFEVIGRECIGMARLINPSLVMPVAEDHAVHVVLECASSDAVDLRAMMESLLGDAIEAGLVADAALAESVAQTRAFWAIREGLVEGQSRRGYHVRTDMSVRLRNIPVLIERARAFIAADHADWEALAYGHAGDGNIHFNALPPVGMKEADARAEGQSIVSGLHAIVEQLGGSISAEHGIGRTRRDAFWASLSPVHKRLVRSIKSAIDPDDIMNPGCLLPTGDKRR